MVDGDGIYAAGRLVATAADEYAKAVTEAAGIHRRAVARLVSELLGAETMAAAERIKAQLTTVQYEYEAVLMTETIAMQARNDQLAAELRELDKRQRSD